MKLYDLLGRLWVARPAPLRTAYQSLNRNHSVASLVLPDRVETVEIKAGIAKGAENAAQSSAERSLYLGTYEEDVQGACSNRSEKG